ncbi:MAG: HAMP domain-containing sensor histidine kinase [Gemmatimonadales bacterium]|nr:HAMP domain-containing sensor histidine kinase [Gemmatimonadales bacterium]HQW66999.1 HAMP domain-containing sensor histidine kinase [Gemmatimonadales bacterium]
MSRLSFRARLFLALLVVSVLPVAVLTGGLVVVLGTFSNSFGGAAVATVGATAKVMNSALNGIGVPGEVRLAIDQHLSAVNTLVTQTNMAQGLGSLLPAWLAGALTVVALALLAIAAGFVRVLSRQLAGPLDEIVEWTGRIRRREALPADRAQGGIPEFALLRGALRDLAQGLEQARVAELEAERLRAFGEVARRVAHEMKNPLTPIRLAVSQLTRTAPPEMRESLEVIAAESARLEAMAREFSELGRLPEGISAPVDLHELLDDLMRSALPASMDRQLETTGDVGPIEGYYDPLRRAFLNLLRNAVEACGGQGKVTVSLRRDDGQIEVRLHDSGHGVPPEKRDLIFQPYFTDKGDGTGLGLAIVRQTIEQHGGTIALAETDREGATFLIRFPA